MSNQNIKVGIKNAFIAHPMEDNIDQLIASSLLYDLLERIIKSEENLQNDIRALAETYLKGYVKKVLDAKSNLVSYESMRAKAISYRKNDFMLFTRDNIKQIVDLYNDKTAIVKFSTQYFSQYMYKLLNIPYNNYNRLSENHFAFMVPVMNFYIDKYGLNSDSMEISSAMHYPPSPGKEISFKIKSVEPASIVSNISTGRIPLVKDRDYHSVKVSGDLVKVIFS
jgi:hypothetical protein